MKYRKYGDTYFVRFDAGEEIIEAFKKFAVDEHIEFAEVNGIGAIKKFETGVLDPASQEYTFNEFEGNFEIVSCEGNIAWRKDKDKPYVHLHMAASCESGCCYGGHLTNAVISATGEFFVNVIPGAHLKRVPKDGIKVISFEED